MSVGEAASRQFMTLYGYGARRIRKSNLGRFSIARTTRLMVPHELSQRDIESRNRERETINTRSAPDKAAK